MKTTEQNLGIQFFLFNTAKSRYKQIQRFIIVTKIADSHKDSLVTQIQIIHTNTADSHKDNEVTQIQLIPNNGRWNNVDDRTKALKSERVSYRLNELGENTATNHLLDRPPFS